MSEAQVPHSEGAGRRRHGHGAQGAPHRAGRLPAADRHQAAQARRARAPAPLRGGGPSVRAPRPREHRPHLRLRAGRGELCIILEYIDGWSLVEYLERHRELGYLPDVELSVFIASRVCRALQYVFEKARIVHRDISPSNIMMTTEGTVKLIDFGIAARSGARESYLAGKPAYMAPEMVVERAPTTGATSSPSAPSSTRCSPASGSSPATPPPRSWRGWWSGDIPSPKQSNPDGPGRRRGDPGPARCEREPARRFESAATMGEACEHFLYDKGYGPTNLTLKHYLGSLFGRGDGGDEPGGAPPRADAHPRRRRDGDRALRTGSRPGSPRPSPGWPPGGDAPAREGPEDEEAPRSSVLAS